MISFIDLALDDFSYRLTPDEFAYQSDLNLYDYFYQPDPRWVILLTWPDLSLDDFLLPTWPKMSSLTDLTLAYMTSFTNLTQDKFSYWPDLSLDDFFYQPDPRWVRLPTWPQMSSPAPSNRHHIHWSIVSFVVEKAAPPNWTMNIWRQNIISRI